MLAAAVDQHPVMNPRSPDVPFDFDLLQRHSGGEAARARRTALWLTGLLFLLAASVVALVLYLQTFEFEENLRRRTADAQWLEQGARFHFRRLEDDLQVLAHRTRDAAQSASQGAPADAINAGLLLRQPGVVLMHGWLPAEWRGVPPEMQVRLQVDADRQPGNAEMLAIMQEVARGLRRPAYAGPLKGVGAGRESVIWLAVPIFDRGVFSGNYLASLSLTKAIDAFIPSWFKDSHVVSLMSEQQMAEAARLEAGPFQAFLELPGTDLALQVRNTRSDSPMVPRMFFLVALVCLLGMLAAFYALRRDYVKRQRIESALQAQVALRSAMENAVTIGLRAWDRRGRILYVNRAFCRMVGFDPQALLGRGAPLPYWPKDQADELDLIHRDIIAQGTEQSGVEVQFQHRDGHLVDVLIHEAPLNAADGEQLGWMSSVLDISERKRAERMAARQQEKLEASGRLVAMGEVASTLAHELNQPLGALSGFANGLLNRLRSGRLSDEELMGVVERMEQLSAKAGRIIQRVSAFARRREMSRQPLEVRAFVRRVVEPLQRQRHSGLRLLVPLEPVWIEADALLLEHALLNLINNADYWSHQTARAPVVEVEVQCADGQMLLSVSDSGPGVGPEQRDQIFGAFFSGKDDGMGMGLAICRSVVEAHHGRLGVAPSPSLGGACFTIEIPLVDPGDGRDGPPQAAVTVDPADSVR